MGEGENPDPPSDLGDSLREENTMNQEIDDTQRRREDLQKSMQESFKRCAIESIYDRIERIKPRIHKIKLFGDDHSRGAYNFNQVRSQFKNVQYFPNKRPRSLYCEIYKVTQNGFKTIKIERGLRDDKHGPPCFITIVPEDNLSTEDYNHLLIRFDKSLPDLKPRIVEYTLDLFPTIYFCKGENPIPDETDITLIYHLIRKFIFVKGIKDTWTEFSEVSSNSSTYLKNKQKQLNVYTRGGEKDSKEHDRVRIELAIYRNLLKKMDILTLEDMVRDIKFSETWEGVLHFEHFKSPHMPEDHKYLAEDKYGNFDAFQLEYLKRYKSHKDMTKYKESLKELDLFKERLSKVAKEFDEEWKWPQYSRIFMCPERHII
ncbi:MAG: hypothetical protein A2157_01515 [Deltaproteobacteria bacterium RBG_16_47_11]|nr:MAG: hypothetical protein A2157_01515 [Deltaproteobacteria bacterium RBG_16_47_11]